MMQQRVEREERDLIPKAEEVISADQSLVLGERAERDRSEMESEA